MFVILDDCIVTTAWDPAVSYFCPDKCPYLKEKKFTGNIEDPYNPRHYIACYMGRTVGCITCPGKLEFNQDWNACIYYGKHKTEKVRKSTYE